MSNVFLIKAVTVNVSVMVTVSFFYFHPLDFLVITQGLDPGVEILTGRS